MKNKILYIICVVLGLSWNSCSDFLDRAPDLNLDEDKVFSNYETAYLFQADVYSDLRKRFAVIGDWMPPPMACASDEATGGNAYSIYTGAYDGVDNVLERNYAGIRKANKFLSKTDIIPFPDEITRDRLIGEVYFLRAFYFHEIIKRYGGMPILSDIILSLDDDLNYPRNSYRECVDAVLADLNKAISMLPVSVPVNQIGRITKGAAMALKARMLLYAASPVWNNEIINADKWRLAANAALEVIDLKEDDNNVYKLYSTGAGVSDYEQQFFVRPPQNTEVIFWYNDSPKSFGDEEVRIWAVIGEGFPGGAGRVLPTQDFVEMYEMIDGKLPEESDLFNPARPYENRDPRFYRTIIYNGALWQGRTIETFVGGRQRQRQEDCVTGYYVRKYMSESVMPNTTTTSYRNWQYIRLADVYLMYAEAINEAEGPDKAYMYVNEIRNRSGMPNLPVGLTQSQMRERIKRERAIELAFEEHRWWDVRRWMDGEKYFNGTFHAMDVQKNEDGTFSYTKIPFQQRIYNAKMNLYPIPIDQMNKNIKYVQNPGW